MRGSLLNKVMEESRSSEGTMSVPAEDQEFSSRHTLGTNAGSECDELADFESALRSCGGMMCSLAWRSKIDV